MKRDRHYFYLKKKNDENKHSLKRLGIIVPKLIVNDWCPANPDYGRPYIASILQKFGMGEYKGTGEKINFGIDDIWSKDQHAYTYRDLTFYQHYERIYLIWFVSYYQNEDREIRYINIMCKQKDIKLIYPSGRLETLDCTKPIVVDTIWYEK